MALFTEIVSRTFTAGTLKGVTIEERIPRISAPRAVGSRCEIARPVAGSPYMDVVIRVEPEAPLPPKGRKPRGPRVAWSRKDGQAAWAADMGGDVTLFAAPERTRGFMGDPARGTRWRFGASHWCEATRTSSVWGRDTWRETAATRQEAMRMAEDMYREEIARQMQARPQAA